jgi:phosphate transport system permease protein
MRLSTRKVLDRAFSGAGIFSIFLMGVALLVVLAPIFQRGLGAFFFRGTLEHRRFQAEYYGRGNAGKLAVEQKQALKLKTPIYAAMERFEQELTGMQGRQKRRLKREYRSFSEDLEMLLGPSPGGGSPVMLRDRFGEMRWGRAQLTLEKVLKREKWEYPVAPDGTPLAGHKVWIPRKQDFAGTSLEPIFEYIQTNSRELIRPKMTFFWGFLTDTSKDSHLFGGIWAEVLGTFYLTFGAMLFAIPIGVLSAIFLVEYAREGRVVKMIRICISTLAGVPSIVFGLFGLAFFINVLHVSPSKSVLAGSLTLAVLILPTVIRAAEEALRAVPITYKEAALSLGAGKWRTIWSVILPAALPGILTGVVISMGRAAGETAPIIFTAAVSVGKPLKFWQTLTEPTPALSWNIYNLCSEHEAADQIRHVQYGMVLVLVLLVLLLNAGAIFYRARIAKKLKG